jgi:hypothetical protein
MPNTTINLQDFRTPTAKVFTGRDRGEKVRRDSNIDSLLDGDGLITIIIPEDIRSINPSFLEEFLVNVVSTLGKKGFFEKFQLENKGRYKVEDDLNDAIDKILREENALA